MKLSIITPCSRPLNLPAIYSSILEMKTSNVEWIVIYDNIDIDKRILMYEKNVSIKLFKSERQEGDNYASRQRNIGIENATGDYLYFLDDDNIVHKYLYDKMNIYGDGDNIILFNQMTIKWDRKLNNFNLKNLKQGELDTAQFLVPRKYKSRWKNNRQLAEEYDYIIDLIKEVGYYKFMYVDRLYSFRNYLRRFDVY